jgi:micrococcal nuclease
MLLALGWAAIGCGASGAPFDTPGSAAAEGADSQPPATSAPSKVKAASYPRPGILVAARLVRVVDGDTIKVDWKGAIVSVRYIGMDAPETVRPDTPVAWMGRQASAANTKILARGGGTVYLEKDVSETDQYGRLLRYVWIKANGAWLMVDLELLKVGLAQLDTVPPDVKYTDPWFLDAQAAARRSRIGLWGSTPKPVPLVGATGMVVCGGNRDAPGYDNLNLNGEYVVICNRGSGAVSLEGWMLTDDESRHTYRFGSFTLRAGASVTLFSGAGTNTASALYWNSNGAIWNNDGDCAHLYSPQGAVVSSRCL